ncbi:uncharacterized protein C2845_PM04G29420 [Panicum miliaceum]|uniref:Uncharacterized protein n=1 Tax=Panicum miliaceum TaxID=4540 RepID=A0A3L6QVI5_PANMI|nr:uncharacterized protein C2845_PM04G29420 [Panicum miliaceum]
MDEKEFRRMLELFPVVRSRDYCAEPGTSSRGTRQQSRVQEATKGNKKDSSAAEGHRLALLAHLSSQLSRFPSHRLPLQLVAMEADKEAERHGIEAVIYDSDDVHVVLDTFAGETEVPDSLGVVDTVASAESNFFHGAVAEPLVKNEIDPVDALMVLKLSKNLFMQKLKMAAEKKIGATKAEFFCKAFEEAHEKLVYKELNLDAAKKFLSAYES